MVDPLPGDAAVVGGLGGPPATPITVANQGKDETGAGQASKRHMLLMLHAFDSGGMGRASQFMLMACQRRGHDVRTLFLTTPARAAADQGRLNSASLRHVISLFGHFAMELLARRPAVVYLPIAQWGLPLVRDVLLLRLARLVRCRVVIHLHGSQLAARLQQRSAKTRLLLWLLRGAEWAVLSRQLQTMIAGATGSSRVTVLHNPVDAALDGPLPGRTNSRVAVGYLGLQCLEKGTDIVVYAAREARRRGINATLVVAGPKANFAFEPTAFTEVDLGNLDHHRVEEEFWPRVDILLLPARWTEGLPFVVLEALQHRCIVGASDSPGLDDLLTAGAVARLQPTVASCADFIANVASDLARTRANQQAAWESLSPRHMSDAAEREWVAALMTSAS